jgi:hypothetical protein
MVQIAALGQDVIVKLLQVAADAGDSYQLGVKINNNEDSLWMSSHSLLDLINANHPDVKYTILTIR